MRRTWEGPAACCIYTRSIKPTDDKTKPTKQVVHNKHPHHATRSHPRESRVGVRHTRTKAGSARGCPPAPGGCVISTQRFIGCCCPSNTAPDTQSEVCILYASRRDDDHRRSKRGERLGAESRVKASGEWAQHTSKEKRHPHLRPPWWWDAHARYAPAEA